MADSLYERVGGENAVMATAGLLYQKLLADPRLSPFFEGVDMSVQVKKMTGFMMWALGGPHAEFRPLRQAHARLVREKGLSNEHFDLVAQHLAETLRELGVEKPLIGEIITIVATTRDEVLGH
jgi:hemoglobin